MADLKGGEREPAKDRVEAARRELVHAAAKRAS